MRQFSCDDPNTITDERQTAGNESWYAEEQSVAVISGVAKATIEGIETSMQEPSAGSKEDDRGGVFGCGSIDIKGGPSGTGGMASFITMLALPFVMRWGRRRLLNERV